MTIEEACVRVKEYIKKNSENHTETTFRDTLYKYMKQKNMKNSRLYKKARIDRRKYSKCVVKNIYPATRNTVASLGLALELNIQEMSQLFESAGFSFSFPSKINLVLKFCIENRIFNIEKVNLILDELGEMPLYDE